MAATIGNLPIVVASIFLFVEEFIEEESKREEAITCFQSDG